jgi:hypothetical protein
LFQRGITFNLLPLPFLPYPITLTSHVSNYNSLLKRNDAARQTEEWYSHIFQAKAGKVCDVPQEKVKLAERIYVAHQLDFFERHIISQGQRELPSRNAFRNAFETIIW